MQVVDADGVLFEPTDDDRAESVKHALIKASANARDKAEKAAEKAEELATAAEKADDVLTAFLTLRA